MTIMTPLLRFPVPLAFAAAFVLALGAPRPKHLARTRSSHTDIRKSPRALSRSASSPHADHQIPASALETDTSLRRPPPSNPHSGPAANAALPARGFLLGRLSNAGPAAGPISRVGAGVRNPSSKP